MTDSQPELLIFQRFGVNSGAPATDVAAAGLL